MRSTRWTYKTSRSRLKSWWSRSVLSATSWSLRSISWRNERASKSARKASTKKSCWHSSSTRNSLTFSPSPQAARNLKRKDARTLARARWEKATQKTARSWHLWVAKLRRNLWGNLSTHKTTNKRWRVRDICKNYSRGSKRAESFSISTRQAQQVPLHQLLRCWLW